MISTNHCCHHWQKIRQLRKACGSVNTDILTLELWFTDLALDLNWL